MELQVFGTITPLFPVEKQEHLRYYIFMHMFFEN